MPSFSNVPAADRLLDVWLIDLNEVYSAVPFTVIADWLQQGRLLAEDRVRLAGNKKWHTFATVPAFAPYLPKAEPLEAADQAEALEPVDLGLDWKRPHEDEDEDVDMIPLIDISLVLLIFFMMTATVTSGMLSPIDTPPARHKLDDIIHDSLWLGIEATSQGGAKGPWFSLGRERKQSAKQTLDIDEVTAELAKQLLEESGEVTIRMRAERTLPIETIRDATLELQGLEKRLNDQRGPDRKLRFNIVGEVSEPSEG
jgi:biopolymer transport protein ExbD